MPGWDNFFFAEVGSSAALAGLILVGVSINLTKILSLPQLTARAFEALLPLMAILIVSSLLLVPNQPIMFIGLEVLILAVVFWVSITWLDIRILRQTDTQHRWGTIFNLVLSQCAILPYLISGVSILAVGANGIYWLVPAVILSFIKAIRDAWVLLVEVNR